MYVLRTNKMYTFFILLHCLRHVSDNQVFIFRKTFTCSFKVLFMHLVNVRMCLIVRISIICLRNNSYYLSGVEFT